MNIELIADLRKCGIHVAAEAVIHSKTRLLLESPVHLGSINWGGASSHIGSHTYFATGRIGSLARIGRFCSVAPGVSIGLGQHPTDWLSTHPFQYGASPFNEHPEMKFLAGGLQRSREIISTPPVIGNDVWIGANVIIFRGVTIGDGAIIAAGAVINGDVPPYAIVGGVPAKIIKYRFEQSIIEALLDLKWWQYDMTSLSGLPFNDIGASVDELLRRRDNGALVVKECSVVKVMGGAFE